MNNNPNNSNFSNFNGYNNQNSMNNNPNMMSQNNMNNNQSMMPQNNYYQNMNYKQNNNPYNGNYNMPNMNNQPSKKNNSKVIIIIVCVVIAILAIILVVSLISKSKNNKDNNSNITSNSNIVEESNNNSNIVSSNSNESSNSNVNNNSNKKEYDVKGNFLMAIEDVFTITGRGTVVTGKIERGTVKIGDKVQIIGLKDKILETQVIGIEMFRKQLDYAEAGDNAGIYLKAIARNEVERGQVLAKPNSIKNYKKFEAKINVLKKEEGGRHTPFFNNYRPQFYFRTTDINGVVRLMGGVEMVNPGDTATINVELINPMAMEIGTEFSIREGGRTVANGTVTKLLEN